MTNVTVNLVSKSEFHVLSNSALVFAVSQTFCTRKWVKPIHGKRFCIFSIWDSTSRKIKCTIRKRDKLWLRLNTMILH